MSLIGNKKYATIVARVFLLVLIYSSSSYADSEITDIWIKSFARINPETKTVIKYENNDGYEDYSVTYYPKKKKAFSVVGSGTFDSQALLNATADIRLRKNFCIPTFGRCGVSFELDHDYKSIKLETKITDSGEIETFSDNMPELKPSISRNILTLKNIHNKNIIISKILIDGKLYEMSGGASSMALDGENNSCGIDISKIKGNDKTEHKISLEYKANGHELRGEIILVKKENNGAIKPPMTPVVNPVNNTKSTELNASKQFSTIKAATTTALVTIPGATLVNKLIQRYKNKQFLLAQQLNKKQQFNYDKCKFIDEYLHLLDESQSEIARIAQEIKNNCPAYGAIAQGILNMFEMLKVSIQDKLRRYKTLDISNVADAELLKRELNENKKSLSALQDAIKRLASLPCPSSSGDGLAINITKEGDVNEYVKLLINNNDISFFNQELQKKDAAYQKQAELMLSQHKQELEHDRQYALKHFRQKMEEWQEKDLNYQTQIEGLINQKDEMEQELKLADIELLVVMQIIKKLIDESYLQQRQQQQQAIIELQDKLKQINIHRETIQQIQQDLEINGQKVEQNICNFRIGMELLMQITKAQTKHYNTKEKEKEILQLQQVQQNFEQENAQQKQAIQQMQTDLNSIIEQQVEIGAQEFQGAVGNVVSPVQKAQSIDNTNQILEEEVRALVLLQKQLKIKQTEDQETIKQQSQQLQQWQIKDTALQRQLMELSNQKAEMQRDLNDAKQKVEQANIQAEDLMSKQERLIKAQQITDSANQVRLSEQQQQIEQLKQDLEGIHIGQQESIEQMQYQLDNANMQLQQLTQEQQEAFNKTKEKLEAQIEQQQQVINEMIGNKSNLVQGVADLIDAPGSGFANDMTQLQQEVKIRTLKAEQELQQEECSNSKEYNYDKQQSKDKCSNNKKESVNNQVKSLSAESNSRTDESKNKRNEKESLNSQSESLSTESSVIAEVSQNTQELVKDKSQTYKSVEQYDNLFIIKEGKIKLHDSFLYPTTFVAQPIVKK